MGEFSFTIEKAALADDGFETEVFHGPRDGYSIFPGVSVRCLAMVDA